MRASEKPWTSAGVSAGIDLAVEAINDLADRELCAAIEDQMEWRQRWNLVERWGATDEWLSHRPVDMPRQ